MSTENPVIGQLQAEIADLSARLEQAQAALLAERFRDVPRLSEGDLVLVPRKLFGKTRLWPARIGRVHLSWNAGTDAHGIRWENRTVSYAVFLQQQDGTYGGSSHGYYHSEVQPVPPPARQEGT